MIIAWIGQRILGVVFFVPWKDGFILSHFWEKVKMQKDARKKMRVCN